MKNVFLALVLAFLLFGCIGEPAAPQEPADNVSDGVEVTDDEEPYTGPLCEPDYSFSEISTATLSQAVPFRVNAACADGKTVFLVLNGDTVGTYGVEGNEEVIINFQLVALKDGANEVKVLADEDSIYQKAWDVLPLGNIEFSSTDYDSISIKDWKAVSFDVENSIKVTNVKAFLRRLYYQVKPGTMIVLELRNDANGNPSEGVVASTSKPLDVATLNERWLTFDFDSPVSLNEGKYWLVFKVTQEADAIVSDVVNLYYLPVDKESPGNDYTRVMRLEWDELNEIYLESSWEPLPFDKNYAVVLSAE